WFVPGGRILKDETMADAFNRLIQVELNVKNKSINDSQLIDVFEHFYADNFSGDEFSTHYVVIGRSINLDIDLMLLPVDQHNDYKWFDETALLNDETVHKHSKCYFIK
ncbi:MAG: NUDIX domain-containing protein, partial [Saccharospirillaceae bacterium]|nr:NUDIX domain-containing protein [Pseudomonadales bacterium]NRB81508.1 NUDIX domain-containing protein [Saccharospirillaceae bacterium]